jgi:hypothetical protein
MSTAPCGSSPAADSITPPRSSTFTYLGVTEPDITAAMTTTFDATEPPPTSTGSKSSPSGELDVRDVVGE